MKNTGVPFPNVTLKMQAGVIAGRQIIQTGKYLICSVNEQT